VQPVGIEMETLQLDLWPDGDKKKTHERFV
jgi:hypothetical protein